MVSGIWLHTCSWLTLCALALGWGGGRSAEDPTQAGEWAAAKTTSLSDPWPGLGSRIRRNEDPRWDGGDVPPRPALASWTQPEARESAASAPALLRRERKGEGWLQGLGADSPPPSGRSGKPAFRRRRGGHGQAKGPGSGPGPAGGRGAGELTLGAPSR